MFAGPISESVPSSITGFAHRRPRSDSLASFTYLQRNDETSEWSDDQPFVDEDGDINDARKQADSIYDTDLESGETSPPRPISSVFSRDSVEDPLLHRWRSSESDGTVSQRGARTSQKIYVVSEDLTIVLAGFVTRRLGIAIYVFLCAISAGLGYLIFRWLPSWKVRLVGSPKCFRDCDWVVIEVG